MYICIYIYGYVFIYNMVKKQLFSPSGLMNYIRCDLICDYLDLYDDTDKIDKVNKESSFDYIMDGGKEYEKQVIEQIYLMHDPYSYHILKLIKKINH